MNKKQFSLQSHATQFQNRSTQVLIFSYVLRNSDRHYHQKASSKTHWKGLVWFVPVFTAFWQDISEFCVDDANFDQQKVCTKSNTKKNYRHRTG